MRLNRKGKILATALVTLAAAGSIAYASCRPDPVMMEYRVTAQPGDTVWGICSRIATDRDDMREVVYRAKVLSGIQDAARLQPGQEVRVQVRALE